MNINSYFHKHKQHTLLLAWYPVQLKSVVPPEPLIFIIILSCPWPSWRCLCSPGSPSPSSQVAAAAACWRPWLWPRSGWGWPWVLSTRWWGHRRTSWPSTPQGGSPACPPAEPFKQVRTELSQCLHWNPWEDTSKQNTAVYFPNVFFFFFYS